MDKEEIVKQINEEFEGNRYYDPILDCCVELGKVHNLDENTMLKMSVNILLQSNRRILNKLIQDKHSNPISEYMFGRKP